MSISPRASISGIRLAHTAAAGHRPHNDPSYMLANAGVYPAIHFEVLDIHATIGQCTYSYLLWHRGNFSCSAAWVGYYVTASLGSILSGLPGSQWRSTTMRDGHSGEDIRAQFAMSDGATHDANDQRNSLKRDAVLVPFPQGGRRDTDSARKLALRAADPVTASESGVDDYRVHSLVLQPLFNLHKKYETAVSACGVPVPRYTSPMVKTSNRLTLRPPEDFKTIAAWLGDVCSTKRGSRRMIADIAGVSVQNVGYWINGRKNGKETYAVTPSRDAVIKIADAFRTPRRALLQLAGHHTDDHVSPEILAPQQRQNSAENSGQVTASTAVHLETAEMLEQWHKLAHRQGLAAARRSLIEHMRALNQMFETATSDERDVRNRA